MSGGGGDRDHPHPEPQRENSNSIGNRGLQSSPLNKMDVLRDSKMAAVEAVAKPQELTLSYLCVNNQPELGLGFGQKGKEVVFSAEGCSDRYQEKWVERDFLNLSETRSNSSSKRNSPDEDADEGQEEAGMEIEKEKEKKKPKLEGSLNLSLALPDVSLSLTAANVLQNGVKPKGVGLAAGPAPSFNNTQTTCSDDFTAPYSLSCSFSHAFSHNASCSMTRNSTDNFGGDDPIWCGGEGTNGSVHSRFRPIGEGIVALNNNNGGMNGVFGMLQGNRLSNKDSCNNNSICRATSSDNISFFPSELPARPRLDTYSGDFRKKESENLRGLEDGDGSGGARVRNQLSRPERIVREIVSESTPVMAPIIQELTQEMLTSIRDYVKVLVSMADKREELISLQNRLGRRSDLTKESLLKCQKDQLEILVAVKMGQASYVSGKVRLATTELIEMFLFVRCRNVNCKSILPVEDCECKFCSANNGFCSSCMCPVCMKFDCATNTCSWVGCDVCSHWCHAACGVQKNLIRPGPSLKGPPGTNEIQSHCIACNHVSEMFGFVKDVFTCCAKDWGYETLLKELDCVRKIFMESDDFKGRELHTKADGLISKLESKHISPSDACHIILKFFDYADRLPDFPAGPSAKEMMPRNTESSFRKEAAAPIPQHTSLPPRYAIYNNNNNNNNNSNNETNNSVSGSSTGRLGNEQLKTALLLGDLKVEDEYLLAARKDGFESLESIVRVKEAECRMFQSKADEARREAEGLKRMIQLRTEKFEDEYAHKLSKLCLQETSERRKKKLDELKKLENSHCDYYNMKMRMQAEIAGLLERMEATKQQMV